MNRDQIMKLLGVVSTASYLGLFIVTKPKSKQTRKLNRKVYNDTLREFKREVMGLKAMK